MCVWGRRQCPGRNGPATGVPLPQVSDLVHWAGGNFTSVFKRSFSHLLEPQATHSVVHAEHVRQFVRRAASLAPAWTY